MYTAVLLDDELWTLRSLESMFPWDKYNFELLLATTNSNEARDTILSSVSDLVITDISMPEISGIDLMRLAKDRRLRTKFVVISAHDNFTYAQEALRCGTIDYLLKPVSKEDADRILQLAKEYLDSRNTANILPKNAKFIISNQSFAELLEYINCNYMERLSLNSVAALFSLNPSYCCQLFQKYFNCSFSEYVTTLKMTKAKDMLSNGKNVLDTANFLNYEYSYFNKIFKKYYGCTPYSYIKGHQK